MKIRKVAGATFALVLAGIITALCLMVANGQTCLTEYGHNPGQSSHYAAICH